MPSSHRFAHVQRKIADQLSAARSIPSNFPGQSRRKTRSPSQINACSYLHHLAIARMAGGYFLNCIGADICDVHGRSICQRVRSTIYRGGQDRRQYAVRCTPLGSDSDVKCETCTPSRPVRSQFLLERSRADNPTDNTNRRLRRPLVRRKHRSSAMNLHCHG